MLVRDIVERSVASSSSSTNVDLPRAPSYRGSGSFPPVVHRSLRSTAPKSAFSRKLEDNKSRLNGEDTRPFGLGIPVETVPKVLIKQVGQASPPSQDVSRSRSSEANEIRRSVEEENMRRVTAMDGTERELEIRELEERFGGKLIELMMRRKEAGRRSPRDEVFEAGPSTLSLPNDDVASNDIPGLGNGLSENSMGSSVKAEFKGDLEREGQNDGRTEIIDSGLSDTPRKGKDAGPIRGESNITAPSKHSLPSSSAADLHGLEDTSPSALHDKYYQDIPPENAKLEWLLPSTTSTTSTDDTLRFDLSGRSLSSAAMVGLPSHLGLHHHGSSPDLAGYTIEEIIHLCRSTVTSQRITMMGVLTKICLRYSSQHSAVPDKIGMEVEKLRVRERAQELGVEVLRGSLRSVGLLRAGIELLFHALGGGTWDWLETVETDCASFYSPSSASDQATGIASVPFGDLIQPLTDILSMDGGITRETIQQLVLILRRAVCMSEDMAATVCPLIPIVLRYHVLRPVWPIDHNSNSTPSLDALHLLKSITISSRACAEVLLRQNSYEPLLKFLVIKTWTSSDNGGDTSRAEKDIATEVMRIFYALGRYGLFSSTATAAADIWRDIGSWASSRWTGIEAGDDELLSSSYFNCLRIWTVCAIDPHQTTPEHDLTWAQVSALGWKDEALSAVSEVMSRPATESNIRILVAATQMLVAWIEGSIVNSVRGGETEKQEVLVALKATNFDSALKQLSEDRPGLARSYIVQMLTAAIQLHNRLSHPSMENTYLLDSSTIKAIYSGFLTDSGSDAIALRYELLKTRAITVTQQSWTNSVVELLAQLQPGQEPIGLDLVDMLISTDWSNDDYTCGPQLSTLTHKDGLQLLRPLLHHVILPDISHVVGPIIPAHLYLKVTTTLRRQSLSDSNTGKYIGGLPLQPDWVFTPIDELLQSGSSLAFTQAPADWDASETDIVRATLILARILQSSHPSIFSRSHLILNLMKIFMLEHGQSQESTSESDIFRDHTVSDALTNLLRPLSVPPTSQVTLSLSTAPLEKAALPFLGPGVPFYQFYVDFLALYEAISFSDPTFGLLLLPPLSQTYPSDYRKLLWSEQSTALRTLRFRIDQVPLEQSSVRAFFEPLETDRDILAGYTRALLRGWVSELNTQFLFRIAVHHLSGLFWTEGEDEKEKETRSSLLVAILSSGTDTVVKAVFEHDLSTPQGAEIVGEEEKKRRFRMMEGLAGPKGIRRVLALDASV